MTRRVLRKGVTTGLCAAAAAQAATTALLGGDILDQAVIMAKDGELKQVMVASTAVTGNSAVSGVVKDAGDDPDVTHGMTVYATVSRSEAPGIHVDGGEGIGRVTKPGLKVAVGQAAINPVPMQMITAAVAEVAERYGARQAFDVVISIPGGSEVAKRTMNARLGVIGGLSVLGTSGVVQPMSDQALIDTVKAEIDVQVAAGKGRLLMMPGNYGRDFARDVLGLDVSEAVRFANFIGEAIDHLVFRQVAAVTLVGHAGKLVKLAGGVMDTHSRHGDCRMEIISAHAALAGANQGLVKSLMEAVTSEAAIDLLAQAGLNQAVWESIGQRIGYHLAKRSLGAIAIDYTVFTQEHGILYHGLVNKTESSDEGDIT